MQIGYFSETGPWCDEGLRFKFVLGTLSLFRLPRGAAVSVLHTSTELGSFAGEIRGLVDASRSFISGDFRVCAYGTRAISGAAGTVRRHNLLRRLFLLHPSCQRTHGVKAVRTFSTAAMPHAWEHE